MNCLSSIIIMLDIYFIWIEKNHHLFITAELNDITSIDALRDSKLTKTHVCSKYELTNRMSTIAALNI